MVKATGSFEVLAPIKVTISCDWFLNMGWPGQAITFTGDVTDAEGRPISGIEVSINEKDFWGRLVPIKDSRGRPVIGYTDEEGHYFLVDDDGWPDGGAKTVWAHAYNEYDEVSPALKLTVIALPWWWPIPVIGGGFIIIAVGGVMAYQELKRRELMEHMTVRK